MSTMQGSTSSVKAEWTNYREKAEAHYLEDTAAVEIGKKDLEEVLQNWYGPLEIIITIISQQFLDISSNKTICCNTCVLYKRSIF